MKISLEENLRLGGWRDWETSQVGVHSCEKIPEESDCSAYVLVDTHSKKSLVNCYTTIDNINKIVANKMIMHSDSDSSKMDLRNASDNSKMDLHGDNDSAKMELHSDSDSGKTDLHSDGDSCKMDSQSDGDSCKMDLHSDTDSGKMDLESDSDAGVADMLSESEGKKTSCSSNCYQNMCDVKTVEIDSAQQLPHQLQDINCYVMHNVASNETVSFQKLQQQQLDNHLISAVSIGTINASQQLQQQPLGLDSSLESSTITDEHLLTLVQSLYAPEFITELEHVMNVDHRSSHADSSADGAGVSTWPTDLSAARSEYCQDGHHIIGLEDLTVNKDDIDDSLLMQEADSLQHDVDFLDVPVTLPVQSLQQELQNDQYPIRLQDHFEDNLLMPPGILQHPVDFVGVPAAISIHPLTENSSVRTIPTAPLACHSSVDSHAIGSPHPVTDFVKSAVRLPSDCHGSASDSCEVDGVLIGSAHQAVIPELCCGEDSQPDCDTDTLLWDPTRAEEVDVSAYLQEVQTMEHPSKPKRNTVQFGRWTGENEMALTVLHRHNYNCERALAFLRKQFEWSVSPLTLWSEEECQRFVTGLKVHGKKFTSVQQAVGTRTVREVVDFYYCWKRSERFGSYEDKKKLANRQNPSFTGLPAKDVEDEDLSEVSPWKRGKRERSTSPTRSLINSRHKTPPPVLQRQDSRSSSTTTSMISPTLRIPLSASSSDQHGSLEIFDLTTQDSANCVIDPVATQDSDGSAVVDSFATQDNRGVNTQSHISDIFRLSGLPDSGFRCDQDSSTSSTVPIAKDLPNSEYKCDVNSSGSSHITNVNNVRLSDGEGSLNSSVNSSSSSNTPEHYSKSGFSDVSSDSSDTSSVNSYRSRKRGRKKDEHDELKFGEIFRDIKRLKLLGTSPKGSGRSDVYNSDTESNDSDIIEEATLHRNSSFSVKNLKKSRVLSSSQFRFSAHYMSFFS